MKRVKIKNDDGDTIEIKCDADGTVKIRHSDIDAKAWGELHEYAKSLKQPSVYFPLAEKGIIFNNPAARTIAERFGGYVMVRGNNYVLAVEEMIMIQAAMKRCGKSRTGASTGMNRTNRLFSQKVHNSPG